MRGFLGGGGLGVGLWPSPPLQVGAYPRARTVLFVARVMASAGGP